MDLRCKSVARCHSRHSLCTILLPFFVWKLEMTCLVSRSTEMFIHFFLFYLTNDNSFIGDSRIISLLNWKCAHHFYFFFTFCFISGFFFKFCSGSSQIVAPLLKQFIDLMHGRDEWICCKPCDCSFSCCLRNLFLFLFILGKFKLKELWHF